MCRKLCLYGNVGNDVLIANGDDTLYGELGNDYFVLTGNNNTLVGGQGDDSSYILPDITEMYRIAIYADRHKNENNQEYENTPAYYVPPRNDGMQGNYNTISGGDGNDTFNISGDNNKLSGNNDNDTLITSGNNNRLIGGRGKDILNVSGSYNFLFGEEGDDNFSVNGSLNEIYTGSGKHTIAMNNALENTIYAQDGNDTLSSKASHGDNTYNLGEGRNTVKSSSSNSEEESFKDDTINTGSGDDTFIISTGSNITINASDGKDILYGIDYQGMELYSSPSYSYDLSDITDSTLNMGNGDNEVYGTRNSSIVFGDGDDIAQGTSNALIYGGIGEDTLIGSGEFHGGDDKDTLSGSGEFYGDDGDDTLIGSGKFHGGKGDDTLTGKGTFYGGLGEDEINIGFNNIKAHNSIGGTFHGGDDNDIIKGTDFTDAILNGDGGDDELTFLLEEGTYHSYFHNETLYHYRNELNGGEGKDTLTSDVSGMTYYRSFLPDVVNTLNGGSGDDILISLGLTNDILNGGDGDDEFRISDADNNILGALNKRILSGGDGKDIFLRIGENSQYDGHHTYYGGAGDDIIHAGGGSDTLIGGEGSDILDGGNVTRQWQSPDGDTYYAGHGDTIINYSSQSKIYFNDILLEGEQSKYFDGEKIFYTNGQGFIYEHDEEGLRVTSENGESLIIQGDITGIELIDRVITSKISVNTDDELITEKFLFTDIESSENIEYRVEIGGVYYRFTDANSELGDSPFKFNTDGTYSFDPQHSSFKALNIGEKQTVTVSFRADVFNPRNVDSNNIEITVRRVNAAPYSNVNNEPKNIQNIQILEGNLDYIQDYEEDPLSYAIHTNVQHGTFSLDESGNWTYDPDDDFIGQDQVTISVSDGRGGVLTETLTFNVHNIEGTVNHDVLFGTSSNDIVHALDGDDIIMADKGNDILYGGEGADTYVYNRRDGRDTIYIDNLDKVIFAEGNILREDIEAKVVDNHLVIGIKEEGKPFETLSDTITLIGDTSTTNFTFSDDKSTTSAELLKNTFFIEKGIGKQVINDNEFDVLRLSSLLSKHDLIVKKENENYLLGVKEEGKSFDELADVITINRNFVDKLTHNDDSKIILDTLSFRQDINSFENTVHITGNGSKNITVQGEITPLGGAVSVDYWYITHAGGELTMNVISEYNGDINGDNTLNVFDSTIYLYKDSIASGNLIASNDDSTNNNDTHEYDAGMTLPSLESGQYILAVSAYYFEKSDVLKGVNSYGGGRESNDDRTGGPYQINISSTSSTIIDGKKIGSSALTMIKEGDGLETIYQGSLEANNEDVGNKFFINKESITLNNSNIEQFNLSLVDSLTGEYKIDGVFDSLIEGEELIVSFEYVVHYADPEILSSVQEVNLVITGANEAPLIDTQQNTVEFSLQANETVEGNLNYIMDPEGDTLTYSATVDNGIFEIDENGTWTYTPNQRFLGEDKVEIMISDGSENGVVSHILTFNVEGVSLTIEKGMGIVLSNELSFDRIKISSELNLNNLIIKQDGLDYKIGIREEGKQFDELSDIIIINAYNINRVYDHDGEYLISAESIFNHDLNQVEQFDEHSNIQNNGTTQLQLNGEITYLETDMEISIDYWHFSHAGGDISFDVLSENNGDINGDTVENGFDTYIYLYKDNPVDGILIDSNDDSDGTDSALSLSSLESGEYVLVISAYALSEDEIKTGINLEEGALVGPYQIDIVSTNPTYIEGKKTDLNSSSSLELIETNQFEMIHKGFLPATETTRGQSFNINETSINVNKEGIVGLKITLLDQITGEYQIEGDFTVLEENEELLLGFEYEVNSPNGLSTVNKANLTIIGSTNSVVEITNLLSQTMSEDEELLKGTILATSPNPRAQLTYETQNNVDGFSLNQDGTYTFDPSHETYQALTHGELKELHIAITASDNEGNSDTQTLVIQVIGHNDAPVIEDIAMLSLQENSRIITGELLASDVDLGTRASLRFSANQVAGFTLNSDGSYTFNPSHEAYQHLQVRQSQTVKVTVTVLDEFNATTTTDIIFEVIGTNSAPIVESILSQSIMEDSGIVYGQVIAKDSDSDNTLLTYSTNDYIDGFTLNQDGTYSFDSNHITYQSLAQNETQIIEIMVIVSDDLGMQTHETLTITVTGKSDNIVITEVEAIETTEGARQITGEIPVENPDNALLTYSSNTLAGFVLNSDGTYSFDANHEAYKYLAQGQEKEVSVDIQISDEENNVARTLLRFIITGTNSAPIVETLPEINTREDRELIQGQVYVQDFDHNASLTYSSNSVVDGFTLHSDGSYSFDASHETYQALNKDEVQEVSITITVTDEHGASDSTLLLINLTGTNDTPIIEIIEPLVVKEQNVVEGQISASDVDNNTVLSYSSNEVTGFTLNSDGSYSFDASHEAYASLAEGVEKHLVIDVTVNDEHGATSSETLAITVVGNNRLITVEEESELLTGKIVLPDTITDTASLTYTSSHVAGFILNSDGTYSFDARDEGYEHLAQGDEAQHSVVINVFDINQNLVIEKELTFVITGQNDAPVIENSILYNTLEESQVITGIVIAEDVDDNAVLTYTTRTSIEGFTLYSDGSYRFDTTSHEYNTLKEGETQNFSIMVLVYDEHNLSATKELLFTIRGSNDAPTIEVIETTSVQEDDAVIQGQVIATDMDKDAILSYYAGNVAGFTLNQDGSYSFDASHEAYQSLAKDEKKSVRVVVNVVDEYNYSSEVEIVFLVTGTNDTPMIEDILSQNISENQGLITGRVIGRDSDNNASLTFSSSTTISGFSLNSDGTYSFDSSHVDYQTLKKDEVRTITIPISVTDEHGETVAKDLMITVIGTNNGPTVAAIQENITLEDTFSVTGKILASDVDGGEISFSIFKHPDHGVLTITEDGSWHYEVDPTYVGEDRVTIRVLDEEGGFIDKTILFNIDNEITTGSSQEDNLVGTQGNDVLTGMSGDDDLFAGKGDDQLYGGEGVDRLYGKSGDDKLYGGVDDDYLKGGYGSDSYYFNLGDGNDIIKDRSKQQSSDTDTLIFGEGIFKEEIEVSKSEQDLIIRINDNDSVSIKYWFNDSKYQIETISFNDGSSLTQQEISEIVSIEGSEEGESLYGIQSINNTINGYGGDDNLYGDRANDTLYGGVGKDKLYGRNGDDSLYGGLGDDYLKGGYGSDSYYFEQGDGRDIIKDKSASNSFDSDRIVFGESVQKEDITFIFDQKNLLISYGDGDEIEVKYQAKEKYAIERLELADGNYLSSGDIDSIVQQIHAYANENGLDIENNNDIQKNQELMQVITSSWQSSRSFML